MLPRTILIKEIINRYVRMYWETGKESLLHELEYYNTPQLNDLLKKLLKKENWDITDEA